ncbi:hypothetical protein EVAR_96012_1 [Eumeta japonica]|uniref:Uncharacterized protein n=1 Tax=Eumeta variegata TaxID=151549 RepID=A0A4C1XEA8_EUMVA|nr:hypothetical protein EVAR_96012_1 [Eumeta japonica]
MIGHKYSKAIIFRWSLKFMKVENGLSTEKYHRREELKSVNEDGAPPQPTVLYYGAEVEISLTLGDSDVAQDNKHRHRSLPLEAESSNPNEGRCNYKACKDSNSTEAALETELSEKYRSKSSAYVEFYIGILIILDRKYTDYIKTALGPLRKAPLHQS